MASIKPKWYWVPLFPFIPFFITAQLLTPTAAVLDNGQPDKNSLDDITQPTTEEGRTVTQFFGTVLTPPNCVWSGDLKTKKTESHGIHSGYAYFEGAMMTLGGPVDNLLRFYRDDNLAFKGKAFSTGDGPPVFPATTTENFRATFRAQTGKAREKGLGGSRTGRSKIRLYRGNQPDADSGVGGEIDSYLAQAANVGDATRYPGFSYLAMNRVFIGDDAQAWPSYTMVVKRTRGLVGNTTDWPDYEVNATSSGYDEDFADANPAYVLVYILTNTINPNDPWAGYLKIDESLVDIDAFKTAGTTLKTEGCGISFTMDDSKKAGDWIDEICRHIDAKVFFDDTIGKITIKLIRDDYDVDDLDEITSDDYSKLILSRKSQWELKTDLIVKYTSRRTLKETGLANIQNGALKDMLGVVKAQRVVLPMFTYPAAAQAAADRMMRRFFYPLFAGSMIVARATRVFKPGDVFKFPSIPVADITITNIIARVISVNKVDDSETLQEVQWAEDIFNNSGVGVGGADEGDYTETDWRITGAYRFTTIKDAPAELASALSIMVLTARPDGQIATDWQLQQGRLVQDEDTGEVTGDVNVLGEGNTNPTALLNAAYSGPLGDTGRWLDHTATGFTMDGAVDFEEFEDTDEEWQKITHRFLVDVGGGSSENFEIIGVKKLEDTGGGVWRATGIVRGLYGTPKINPWPDNTRVWQLGPGGNLGLVDISDLNPVNGVATDDVWLVQFNQYETGDPEDADFTYGFRAETPYGLAHLEGERTGSNVTLRWATRIRNSNIPFADEVDLDAVPVFDGVPEPGMRWVISYPSLAAGEIYVQLGGPGITIDIDGWINVTVGSVSSETFTVRQSYNGRLSPIDSESQVTV